MKERPPGFQSGDPGDARSDAAAPGASPTPDASAASATPAASAASSAPAAPGAGGNRLAGQSSLYLRQHQHNPVNWWPWCIEALALAQREDKPLLVSIGYSACHWCHVMERESFENEAIAALMNAHFVCIKVDREERPDVDQIYMDAVTRLTGHGGWPLTVFCKPDGTPYYGGTYFPPENRGGMPSFPRVLEAMQRAFREERAQVDESARRIMAAVSAQPRGAAPAPGLAELRAAARDLLRGADLAHGGFGGAPKFPTPALLELLQAGCDVLGAEERERALHHLVFTCKQMATRGLYDPLAGGFHRYCVDHHWGVPHFEKMLYDQAQLLRCYADAWRRSGAAEGDLLWPIHETAAYLRREMRNDEGGLYASQDADSEGVEGKFYVWTPQEVEAALGAEQGRRFCAAYGVAAPGNFEGRSVLWDQGREPHAALAEARATLLRVRAGRVPPATDTKCILGWNALAVSGLAYAGGVCDDGALLEDAVRTARFIERRLLTEDGARRIFAEGNTSGEAFLDDFAAWLAACLDLYRAGADAHWLQQALRAAQVIQSRFFDADEQEFFLTPVHATGLPMRPRTGHDGATPEAGAQAVLGLLRTAELCGRPGLRQTAERALQSRAFAARRAPGAFPTLLRAAARAEGCANVAVVVGEPEDSRARALALAARRALAPEDAVLLSAPGAAKPAQLDPAWFAGREALSGEATAYLCRGVECSLPFTEPQRFAELIGEDPGR